MKCTKKEQTMITCKIIGSPHGLEESENFHLPKGRVNWQYEFLHRKLGSQMKRPIQRFRCKDRKNNINFYYLEFDYHTVNNKKVFSFKSNSDRTLFLLTYFGK